jgi:hypothetical protein
MSDIGIVWKEWLHLLVIKYTLWTFQERKKEWKNERKKEWKNERKKERMNEWRNERMKERKKERKEERKKGNLSIVSKH